MSKTFSKIIRRNEVIALTGLSKSTIYNRIKEGLIPKPISLGFRAVGFIEHEIQEVLIAMANGFSNEEIRSLIRKQEASRTKLGGYHDA
ncbi:helix-turn-helix transcriptional regulator [Thalassotalea sp. PS06]|uniref:helix-turn-helix transcriptional regulator n=1 Tax=Thalassotalea sp. PS06 TaxID=2594005 RepID=UPI00116285D7|nr:AlpA family phage regulatory protein [Thalassotalea sp. PS06]QDP01812.1 AlpA family phage regulatory protein [Thalassotalea sp. PS06]